MKKILPLYLIAWVFSAQLLLAQNAPISTVGDVTSTGSSAIVPITAINFSNIGSCNLQLQYDPAIATCTGVTLGPSLSGGLDFNVSIPGMITFGWYTWPGITLPDNSVIFKLNFTKVAGGTTYVSWNDSYGDRQWSDGNSFQLNDLPLDTYYIDGSLTFQVNAPITIAPVIGACSGTTLAVPITVLDFNTIGVISLTLQFNASVLTYQSFTNNSGFPSLNVFNPNTGNITIAGFVPTSSPGITIADNAPLVTLYFNYLGGNTNLTWYDNGESCEYGGPPLTYTVLNDIPTSTYYINGEIYELCQSIWTGSIDDDWFKTGNWTNGIPSATKDAVIPVVDPNPYPIITGNASCKEADIADGASITIQTTGTLTAYSDFHNDGDLIVKSTSTGDGSFIDNGTITGAGKATVERYLLSQKWHFVSPPISDGVSNIFYDIYLRWYNETNSTWNFIVPVDIPLNTMQGYEAWAADFYTGTTTVSYIGTLNTGNLNRTNLTYTPDAPQSRGYNLVGNPYPSAVDWDVSGGWSKTNLDNSIYIWNPYTGNYRSYVNGVGNNGGTSIIPSGQGFFVHVNSNYSTGSVSVNNNARLHDNTLFLKNDEEITDKPFLRLKTHTDIVEYSDETVIRFFDQASPAFDKEFDAFKLNGLNVAPQLYTFSANLDELSINSLPALINNTMIPLHFKSGMDGIYTIEVISMVNFDETTKVLLEDRLLEQFIDFGEQNSYSFYSGVMDDPDRFNLHFVVNSFGIDDFDLPGKIQIYAVGDNIYFKKSDQSLMQAEVKVYDMMGKVITAESINGEGLQKISLKRRGVFLVKFYDAEEMRYYNAKVRLL